MGQTFLHLVPVLAAMVLIFVADGLVTTAVGVGLAAALLAKDAILVLRSRRLALAD